ncbi:FAD/NAD(P)-binding protein [Streptomyces diastatochromogenes]|nr:FAD/NAD(P)-binding protein [Streptomyces diastatochromogenes]
MTEVRKRQTVAIVGAGAAGALAAVQLCETATRRRTPLDVVLIDAAPKRAAAPPMPPMTHATD